MGPYPLDPPLYYERWKKLTNFITPGLVRRVLPNNGKVSHLPEKNANLTIDESNVKDKRLGRQIEKEEGMEFTPFDLRKSFPTGASGDEITRWSLDKSWLVKDLLKRVYHNGKIIMTKNKSTQRKGIDLYKTIESCWVNCNLHLFAF